MKRYVVHLLVEYECGLRDEYSWVEKSVKNAYKSAQHTVREEIWNDERVYNTCATIWSKGECLAIIRSASYNRGLLVI